MNFTKTKSTGTYHLMRRHLMSTRALLCVLRRRASMCGELIELSRNGERLGHSARSPLKLSFSARFIG